MSVGGSCLLSHLTGWCVCICVYVCVFQGHCHLRYRFRRGVSDGGGGGSVPVRVHVHEERARSAGRRVQHLLHQHRDPGLPRWVNTRDDTMAPLTGRLLIY